MLERIARYNPPLNAVVALAADAALARARAADEARARRESWGPFHGVPITIKDTFEVAGVTTTRARPRCAITCPRGTQRWWRVSRAAGAVILGKTNVPTVRVGLAERQPVYGQTNNPWDVARTPGRLHRRRRRRAGRRAQLSGGGQRPRRLDPHPGPLLRRLRPQALARRRADARAHPAAAGHLGLAALDAAGGGPARALRRRPARCARGAGRARRRRGARVAVVPAARARHAARRLPHRLRAGRPARARYRPTRRRCSRRRWRRCAGRARGSRRAGRRA